MRVTTEEAGRIQQELSSMNSTLGADSNARLRPIAVCKFCCIQFDALTPTISQIGM